MSGSGEPKPPALPHRRLTLNAITNLSRYFVSVVVAFLLTPFVVGSLGNSAYGIWVIVLSAVGYASILELGIQPAIVRLIGHYGPENRRKLDELISAAFFLFAAIGVLAACVVAGLGFAVVDRLDPAVLGGDATHLILLVAIDLVLMFQVYLFSGVLFGLHGYPVRNAIDVVVILVNAGLVVALVSGYGILSLAVAKLASDLVSVVALSSAARRRLPGLRPSWGLVTRDSLKELFSSGGPLFASSSLTRAANYAQPVIIAGAISSAATTFFAIPLRLIDYSREILYALAAGFMPTFSELARGDRRDDVQALYVKYSRLLILITLPINLLLFVLGTSFISLWMGPEYASRGERVVMFLAGSAFIESSQPLLWRLLIGVGHLKKMVQISMVGSVLMVVGALVLIRPFGISGVALAVLIGTACTQVAATLHVSGYLGLGILTVLRRTLGRALAIGLFTLASSLIAAVVMGRDSYPALAGVALATLGAHALLVLRFGIDDEERELVLSRLLRGWGQGRGRRR